MGGRAPTGQALAVPAKPASGLDASRCGPSRGEENTDREIWRSSDDYYSDRVSVTKGGGIGMHTAFGRVIVKTVGQWHFLSKEADRLRAGWASFPRDVAAVLWDMGDGEYCKPARHTAEELGLTECRVQEINKALKVLGFAQCGTLMTDDGAVAGRGYWATGAGERFATALHLAASAIEAGTDETLQAAQPEGQERGPKGDAQGPSA